MALIVVSLLIAVYVIFVLQLSSVGALLPQF